MKPFIHHTSFGSITIGNHTYDHDVLIRSDGHIEKRKKKLSKKVYGTSHTLSFDEAEFIYEEGVAKIIIGCGQHGALELSGEAKELFRKKHVSLILADTLHAVREYNNTEEPCVGLFHITC
ncbi:MAG: MTH938/NDUFAF3 family protein [Bacteroidota bacterium]